ncbi:MAG: amidohydrolase [Spirosomataceae bacterium]
MKKSLLVALVCLVSLGSMAQKKKTATPAPPAQDPDKTAAIANIDKRFNEYASLSKKIWDFAEVGYQEEKSTALLQEQIKQEGFSVQAGVADIPTAFVATYGSGKPVIGILAEFDALPGLSQEVSPEWKPIQGQRAGHGCGHNLFGVASMAAAIELKNWLKATGHSGTIRLYGCPAEEGGSGKVYMVRAGLFNDVDVVLHWHPGSNNNADPSSSLANKSAKFRFRGIAAHASGAPERGRSALDAVEAMDYMVNMMREHVPSDARIHYVITRGGEAPNVVPAYAEVYYYARHKDRDVVQSIWKRIENAAQGAALGTGTKMEEEVVGGVFNLLPVPSLSVLMHKNLTTVGGIIYTDEEKKFAEKLSESLGEGKKPIEDAAKVEPMQTDDPLKGGSTDVGDVSWAVPTVGLVTATWVPGTASHSWQAVACSGMTIGQKGLIVAAKTLALTGLDLFKDTSLIEKARVEWLQKRGANFHYEALLGDRKPALDYRR